MTKPTTFGQRLKRLREAKPVQTVGLTQTQLAALSGLTPQAIHLLENDARRPTLETARKIADALGCTLDDLLPSRPAATVAKRKK